MSMKAALAAAALLCGAEAGLTAALDFKTGVVSPAYGAVVLVNVVASGACTGAAVTHGALFLRA